MGITHSNAQGLIEPPESKPDSRGSQQVVMVCSWHGLCHSIIHDLERPGSFYLLTQKLPGLDADQVYTSINPYVTRPYILRITHR